jgi:hypothetical protein
MSIDERIRLTDEGPARDHRAFFVRIGSSRTAVRSRFTDPMALAPGYLIDESARVD